MVFLIPTVTRRNYSGAPGGQKGRPAEPHRHHGKEKEAHGLIFSLLSWIAVLLVGRTHDDDDDENDDGVAQHSGHTPIGRQRHGSICS